MSAVLQPLSLVGPAPVGAEPVALPPARDASRVPAFWIRHRTALAAAVAVAVALGGTGYLLAPPTTQVTDDAYVGVDATAVAPRVRGFVSVVLVADNQPVKAGDPLVRIEPEEFDARLATAEADLTDAQAGVAAARAALVSQDAEEQLSAARTREAATVISAAGAQAERAAAESVRYDSLVGSGAVARQDADRYRANSVSARQDLARANAALSVAHDGARVTQARRASLEAALAKSLAAVERARASRDLALQDARHTVIRAPIDGVVGNRQVHEGDYVQPGTRLLTLVPMASLYVTANFKETQTARIRPGATAEVKVDALPGQRFTGKVASLAPGSGSQFALLPFEPGTGNFTKIVQRVPVRIALDPQQPGLAALRPGLSVSARVRLAR